MKIRFLLFSILTVSFFSCRSIPKDVSYFQDFDSYKQTIHPDTFSVYDAVIKNNDQLMISVAAPVLDQMQVAQFNLPANTFLSPGETTTIQTSVMQTYTVDPQGNINFPVIGKIRLAGLTRSQAIDLISQKVSGYLLTDPIVNLQIISFKVTVLGEVFKPGQVEVRDGRVSILDALGAVGDLTIYGNRKNVKLIRDNNGIKSYHTFDLTSSDIIHSPYYYLQQNDVVIVDPNNARKKESRAGQADYYRLSIVSTLLGAVTASVAVVGLILKK